MNGRFIFVMEKLSRCYLIFLVLRVIDMRKKLCLLSLVAELFASSEFRWYLLRTDIGARKEEAKSSSCIEFVVSYV